MGVLLTYVEPTVAASVNGTSHKYVCDDNGIWMPFFNESQIPLPLRATLYLLGLIYIFVGIALASDMLMCSIGCITRQTITKKTISGEVKVIPMWNATVANLTLLALGTSAPEILLSIIEVTSE